MSYPTFHCLKRPVLIIATSSSPATKIQPMSSSAPKNTGGERRVSQPASAVPEAGKSRKRRLSETHYDQVFREHGIRGVLDSLQADHGKEFTGAHKDFLAARKSFSEAQYEEVADFFNLQKNTAEDPFEGWADLDVPQVLLPTSVLDEVCMRALQSHVSPGSASELQNEVATAACLGGSDAWVPSDDVTPADIEASRRASLHGRVEDGGRAGPQVCDFVPAGI
ncbi:hypothetical protein B0H10DRAFT_2230354 [Mycena sp. CBHHK59/15]|nr:hypothetical protein B0H10DRAFT_2230354 [Mycena sp. CBHHK59/15]